MTKLFPHVILITEREVNNMAKDFFYNVNGTEFHDTEAFGKAWADAKALAIAEHASIERTVVDGNKISYEFYANSGCFLNERFRTVDKVKVF